MSYYTIEVRYICETEAGLSESLGYTSVDNIIEVSHSKIFDFSYPIFDPDYKEGLEKKILYYYYLREICCETIGLWKMFLNRKMNLIMPYYNQLYKSALISFNPLYDTDLTTTHDGDNTKNTHDSTDTKDTYSGKRSYEEDRDASDTSKQTVTASGKGSDNSTGYDLYSDTPQGGLTGVDSETYLTNARKTTSSGSNEASSTQTTTTESSSETDIDATTKDDNERNITTGFTSVISGTDDYIHKILGKSSGKSYSELLNEYRSTFLNIDQMVINELSDLFLNLY